RDDERKRRLKIEVNAAEVNTGCCPPGCPRLTFLTGDSATRNASLCDLTVRSVGRPAPTLSPSPRSTRSTYLSIRPNKLWIGSNVGHWMQQPRRRDTVTRF